LVFKNREGRPIADASFYRSFITTLERLSIQSYSPHFLRHTHVSLRLREGQDHQYIIQQLGWGNLSMLKVYAHLFRNDDEFRKEQRSKLNGFTLAKLASA
jgi:site-specific recombinase XerD